MLCDLGLLDENQMRFILSTYGIPEKYPGWIGRNDSMRVTVKAEAENGESKELVIEISWDGLWENDVHELEKHLVVKRVLPL